MPETIKEFILDCIRQRKGDDLYRAECAFRNNTDQEMQEEYGLSGKTRQQILDECKAHD